MLLSFCFACNNITRRRPVVHHRPEKNDAAGRACSPFGRIPSRRSRLTRRRADVLPSFLSISDSQFSRASSRQRPRASSLASSIASSVSAIASASVLASSGFNARGRPVNARRISRRFPKSSSAIQSAVARSRYLAVKFLSPVFVANTTSVPSVARQSERRRSGCRHDRDPVIFFANLPTRTSMNGVASNSRDDDETTDENPRSAVATRALEPSRTSSFTKTTYVCLDDIDARMNATRTRVRSSSSSPSSSVQRGTVRRGNFLSRASVASSRVVARRASRVVDEIVVV